MSSSMQASADFSAMSRLVNILDLGGQSAFAINCSSTLPCDTETIIDVMKVSRRHACILTDNVVYTNKSPMSCIESRSDEINTK